MSQKVIVIGSTDVGFRTCDALQNRGVEVLHLAKPSDDELRNALAQDVLGVAVMLHNDIAALRYSLTVEHIKPGIRLFVAIFDRSVRHELERMIPNCHIASPAYISNPSIISAVLLQDSVALSRTETAKRAKWQLLHESAGKISHSEFRVPTSWRLRRIWGQAKGQLRAYDPASRALMGGLFTLIAILVTDIAIHFESESPAHAFYAASTIIAGVTAIKTPEQDWQLVQSGTFMLLTIVVLAIFGAGVVTHILSGRRVTIVGRRVIPKSGHVVIVGLGQVGIRLCKEFSLLKIPVVAIEISDKAPGIALARDLNIPVIIGNASDVRTLKRANFKDAIALLAMGSSEQDNIAVSVAARSLSLDTQVVLRAGTNDAIAETKSLFSIGVVTDVNGLTAAYVTQALLVEPPLMVIPHESKMASVTKNYELNVQQIPGRCACFAE